MKHYNKWVTYILLRQHLLNNHRSRDLKNSKRSTMFCRINVIYDVRLKILLADSKLSKRKDFVLSCQCLHVLWLISFRSMNLRTSGPSIEWFFGLLDRDRHNQMIGRQIFSESFWQKWSGMSGQNTQEGWSWQIKRYCSVHQCSNAR